MLGKLGDGDVLHLLIECNPVPCAVFDRGMRYLMASSRWFEQFRLDKEQVIGHCHYEVFPDLPDELKEVHRRCLAGAVERCEEYAFERADGQMLCTRWEIQPWHEAGGEIGGIIIFSEDITERKENALRLQESEENFRAIVDGSPLPVTVTRIDDGKVMYINDSAVRMFGLSAKDLQGLCASDFYVDPGERREVAALVKKAGHIQDYELRLKRHDGTPIWTNVAIRPISYGGALSWLAVHQDITERKYADELLDEVERSASFGTYRFDIVANVWRCSPVLDEIFGIDADYQRDVDGWLQLIHPEQRTEMKAYLETEILAGHKPFDREFRIVRASDGAERWVHGQGSLRLDANGRPYLLFGSIQDITRYKMAEARSDMFRRAIDQAGEAILITNSRGDIQYVNPAFTRITGYAASEAIGQNPRILNSGNQDEDFYQRMWDSITSGEVWQSRVVDRRKDGSFYPCLLTISAMRDEGGEIAHFIGIQQDLKEYEELEKQFYQSQKMEAIGILVGGIAHDFNNTLAGITGNLYMARKDAAVSPSLAGRLKAIEVLAFRAADMIQQLLAFSRKGTVQMRPLSVAPFLNEAIKLHRVSLPENIRLQYEAGCKSMIVRGDANLLQQALMNLINNARDAVQDARDPIIRVSLDMFEADASFRKKHPQIEAHNFARVRIGDNGTGIREDQIPHIFEPFFTTKEVDRGTGLGLAMVYGAVQSHGGVIEVVSAEGEGAEFVIYLPLLKSPHREKASEGAGDDAAVAGHGELILLADDNDGVLAATREVLEGLNYRVMTVSDGAMAVDAYRQHRNEIGLSILDMVMPKMDGPDAYRTIREIDPAAKVLFATGYDMAGSLDKMPGVSPERVIPKPYTIGELSRLIRSALDED